MIYGWFIIFNKNHFTGGIHLTSWQEYLSQIRCFEELKNIQFITHYFQWSNQLGPNQTYWKFDSRHGSKIRNSVNLKPNFHRSQILASLGKLKTPQSVQDRNRIKNLGLIWTDQSTVTFVGDFFIHSIFSSWTKAN